jgi:periplasmic protein TonB
MTRARPASRGAGWLVAGVCALTLMGGVAAIALAAERQAPVLYLDLASRPPAAPSIAAIAEAAPDVASAALPMPEAEEDTEPGPVVPERTATPTLATASLPPLPRLDSTVTADLFLPPPPETRPKPGPKPDSKPDPKREAKPKPEKTPDPKPKPEKKRKPLTDTATAPEAPVKKAAPASEASAPSAGSKAKGGGMSPQAYAKAVLKKVRSTKKKSGAGRGIVVVGFSIGSDGGLAGVQVLQSSGNAALDRIAVDHIRRSAPFPAPPPEAAGRGYSFEFVGK